MDIAQAYVRLGEKAKANKICLKLWNDYRQYAEWYLQFNGATFLSSQKDCMLYFQLMMEITKVTETYDKALAKKQINELNKYYSMYAQKGGKTLE